MAMKPGGDDQPYGGNRREGGGELSVSDMREAGDRHILRIACDGSDVPAFEAMASASKYGMGLRSILRRTLAGA
jgi:hypothetical protein